GRDHLVARGNRGVDPGDLLRDVVVRVDLGDADAARLQVARGLVDALLEHRPERAGVAVGHDGDLDRARVRRAEGAGRGPAERGQPGGGQAARDEQAAAGELRVLDRLELFVVHRPPSPLSVRLAAWTLLTS